MKEYYGKYKGFIRANDDPEARGRVRVYCPQVMGPTDGARQWLGWAEPCFPWLGGANTGDFGAPLTKIQQLAVFGQEQYGVWIEFQGGKPDFPIWVGTFTIARTPTAASAHNLPVPGGAGAVGGGIIGSPVLDNDDEPLNPPQALIDKEVRIVSKSGTDIIIGCEQGGYIIVGVSGVQIVGPQITLNGASVQASSTKVTI